MSTVLGLLILKKSLIVKCVNKKTSAILNLREPRSSEIPSLTI
jgi:hypothetical protein